MSLDLIAKTDFVGFINIDFKETNDTFDVYAAQAEQIMLTKLFGQAMYDDMLANPTEANYVYLIDNYLKSMQKGFFYYLFNLDRESYNTTLGEFEALAENAQKNVFVRNKKWVDAWNDGLKYYVSCFMYVNDNIADYPLYYDTTEYLSKMNVFGITANEPKTEDFPISHSDWFIRGKR